MNTTTTPAAMPTPAEGAPTFGAHSYGRFPNWEALAPMIEEAAKGSYMEGDGAAAIIAQLLDRVNNFFEAMLYIHPATLAQILRLLQKSVAAGVDSEEAMHAMTAIAVNTAAQLDAADIASMVQRASDAMKENGYTL